MSFHTLDYVSVDKFTFSNQPQWHKKLVQTYMVFSVLTIFVFGKYRIRYSLPDGFLFCWLVFLLRQFFIHHHQS